MQIWAESGKSALPICNYSQILYQFLTFTQNLKRSRIENQEVSDYIHQFGATWHQGYFYSKPVPIEQFEALLDVPH